MSSSRIAMHSSKAALHIPVMLEVEQTAKLMRMDAPSVRLKVAEGTLKGGRLGRRILIDGHSVAAVLSELGINVVVDDMLAEDFVASLNKAAR